MIVQVDYRIAKPYGERLSDVKRLVLEEIARREKGVINLETYRNEKAEKIVFTSNTHSHVCYACLKPVWFMDDEITFVEKVHHGSKKTYMHLDCVKQKL